MDDLAITNSFGMPSKHQDFLREDIPKAQSYLKEGQVMIVSVVGTSPSSDLSPSSQYTEFVRDFATTAAFAKECGAKIVEANFSCPNVATGEGSIFQNPKSVEDIASVLVSTLGDTPLVIKVGTYEDFDLMRNVYKAAAKVGVRGICGINSMSMQVVNSKDVSPLGPSRLVSGVCGAPIRPHAMTFLRKSNEIIRDSQLSLTLLGCGGITLPSHFDDFVSSGAQAALTATGMLWDPLLASRYHSLH